MHLTRYTDYSIRVLTHLSTYPDRLSCIAEIAKAYGISQSHLMKVVQDLGQSGYVETVRGRMAASGCARRPRTSILAPWCAIRRSTLTWSTAPAA